MQRILVPAREGRAVRIPAGSRFRVVDVEGQQIGDLFAFRADDLNLIGLGQPERVATEMVSASFFRLLGAEPILGRTFLPTDDQPGAVPVAHAALEGGATGLAVATLEEAAQIRGLVDAEQILVMGGLLPAQAKTAAATGCSVAVSNRELAEALADSERPVPVHLKIDTGMGRFGCQPQDAPKLARRIDESSALRLAGTWTHFASADSDAAMTRHQFDSFTQAIESLGVDPGLRHACNSAGARHFPEYARRDPNPRPSA